MKAQEVKLKPKAKAKTSSVAKSNPGLLLANLSYSPATQLGLNFNAVQSESATILNTQKTETLSKIPKVDESEGSAYGFSEKKFSKNIKGKTNTKTKATPKNKTITGSIKNSVIKDPAIPEKTPLKITNHPFQSLEKEANIEHAAQNELDSINLDTSSVPTKMEVDPEVQLTGEADTKNLSSLQSSENLSVNMKKLSAAIEVSKDYGENNILKKPDHKILSSKHKIKSHNVKVKTLKGFGAKGLDENLINSNFAPIIESKIGEESKKYEIAQEEHETKVLEAQTDTDEKIEVEKNKSQKAQINSAKETKESVNNARLEWKNGLEKVETDFHTKSTQESAKTLTKINVEKTKGENEAQKHLDEANKKAEDSKKAADKEAAEAKAKKKKESGGFFGWLKDKASALINALKRAMNFIYDNLRKAVKFIFNAAKKLIVAALEFARKLIVGIIKVFGATLKAFVDIAFATFPALRDKIKAKIDGAVAFAEKYVNKAFELFKKIVTAIIDFLAETLDKLLGLIQSIYNGILTVVGMIIRGEIGELLERLGHLKDAIFAISFSSIKQGGMEELLGANLDEPLSPGELMAAMQMGLLSDKGGYSEDGLPKAPWTNANVGVDAVSFEDLSPEMQAELRRMQTEGKTEAALGERNDPSRSMDAVMKEATGSETTPQNATPSKKIDDGLTPMKRAEIKWEMMKAGIKKWWNANWPYVVGGIIAAIVIFVAAEVATGGAITAALPVIMPILEAVFVGVMIAQFGGYLVDGISKAWDGDVKGGTKGFSRGLGAAVIELAMYLGFKVIEVGAKAVMKVVKGGIKLVKTAAKSVLKFAKFIIEKGKVLFKGIAGKNLGKLFKSLRKLGDDILERMRIKKVILKIQGKRWEILAEINPLFVIMAGPMPNEEIGDLLKVDANEANKVLKKGEKYVDDQGRELLKISNLDKFDRTPNYREIFDLTHGNKGISDKVIHHLIEKNSRYAKYFEKELVNAPKSLRAIPKGDINSVLHLSDIRKGWDKIYLQLDDLISKGLINEDGVRNIITDFATKSDGFIGKSLTKIVSEEARLGRALTKDEIAVITDSFKHLLN